MKRLLRSPLVWISVAVTALWVGVSVLMQKVIGRRLFITGDPVDLARQIGIDLEHVEFFASDGVRLHGWLHKAANPRATILFMHGTSYSTLDMVSEPERAELFGRFLEQVGCDWFMFDYRGYGPSEGTPSEAGIYRDAEAALSYMHSRGDLDMSRLVFYGFSMGSAVAVEMAVRHPCLGLMLRAPFSSIRDMSEDRVPVTRYIHAFMPWLPRTRFDTRAKIGRVRAPLLVMHGDSDLSVPVWMGRWVYELAGSETKTFIELKDTAHGDFPIDQIIPAISGFIATLGDELVAPAPSPRGWRLWNARGDRAGERYLESSDGVAPPAAVVEAVEAEEARPPA
ncbi:MAG TPA: alpha/beta hydrolase [Dehalococcoidia bacterium]|nr:alpha/beta hydrolase [Dehalococcoidia bacterium]